jgi:hypothetical protein
MPLADSRSQKTTIEREAASGVNEFLVNSAKSLQNIARRVRLPLPTLQGFPAENKSATSISPPVYGPFFSLAVHFQAFGIALAF